MGTIIWYAASTPPAGWLICNGQSTAGYPVLAAVVGLYVPDLRGEFIRGVDLDRGIDFGRALGSLQVSQTGDHYHGTGNFSGLSGKYADDWIGISRKWSDGISYLGQEASGESNELKVRTVNGTSDAATATSNQINISGSIETRPRNISLLPCIKY